ncbi:hypothetical protein AMATHDRAFT_74206 [Amanita thiersii Skay4041]|uniref:PPP4R2-domain-containing protein n=1 Tax=Amanita thiersii Skay4041 TaxID=703135 RepID=A0A2A9NSU2_9AGAR|nr:hypothetical protein AMATHDRAFT_74206 [Amanita thiersii Skay4041]
MSNVIPTDFQWRQEYDAILSNIASHDLDNNSSQLEWPTLRNAIKSKLENNISAFLQQTSPPSPPPPFEPMYLTSGGLKLPPFPPRKQTHMILNETPVSYMNEKQATAYKLRIFDQLHEFDSQPPFTIQRLCELCVQPKKHYKSVGKYLRAVEKSILVTSSWDSFPAVHDKGQIPSVPTGLTLSAARHSTPATPLFSPIPFLHDDPRRSRSRSPPPSPLALGATAPAGDDHPVSLETKALGLVDELDDPGPGHLSDHPTALTAVTTVSERGARPLIGSLEDRFIKSEHKEDHMENMEVDDKGHNKG